MEICGLNKTTLLDYPGRTACTVFTGNCNFRCVFCHNSALVLSPALQEMIPEEDFFAFLDKRRGILQGVCITGGEPTLMPDLSDFIKKIRSYSYPVKLDTNGYRPEVLRDLLEDKLIDMVAMDIKTDRDRYPLITGIKDLQLKRLDESIELLMKSGIEYEFRTTVVKEYFDEEAAENIGKWLKGAKCLYLQQFKDGEGVMQSGLHCALKEDMEEYVKILSKYIDKVGLRGVD